MDVVIEGKWHCKVSIGLINVRRDQLQGEWEYRFGLGICWVYGGVGERDIWWWTYSRNWGG